MTTEPTMGCITDLGDYVAPQCRMPDWQTDLGDHLSYRVWARDPVDQEDDSPWKCLGCFRFLQEALDYIAYCQDRGSDVVFQSPVYCRVIRATDRRVVYKGA